MARSNSPSLRPDAANILLVDDTPAKLLTYEVVLADLGERLLRANSVEEALRVLLQEDIALIVTDVSMPETDGFTFASMVREHPRFRSIPIIFVSAIADTDPDRLKGYASGAVDYVTAPIHPELLRAKIKVFLELYRKQRELSQLKLELEMRVAERTAELERSARRLALSEERYRSLIENANDIVATFDLDLKLTSVNPAIALLGFSPEEMVGKSLAECVPPAQVAMHEEMLARKLDGENGTRYEMELYAKDHERRFTLEVSSKLMVDEHGAPQGIHAIARDITERKEAELRQHVLIHELQHRTKNLLAVVQSIVLNTLARSRHSEDAREAIMGRLQALGRAQEFVASGPASGVSIRQLLDAELSAFTHRIATKGIDFMVGGGFAQQFALVIHELATNAAKYGSLSRPEGQLQIEWVIDRSGAAPTFYFLWREAGGPAVQEPMREGFGSQLIAAIFRNANRSFTAGGVEFSAQLPLADMLQISQDEANSPIPTLLRSARDKARSRSDAEV